MQDLIQDILVACGFHCGHRDRLGDMKSKVFLIALFPKFDKIALAAEVISNIGNEAFKNSLHICIKTMKEVVENGC